MGETERKWVPHNRVIVEGDVVRIKLSPSDTGFQVFKLSRKSPYLYAVATGRGFGSNPALMGNAVFVRWVSANLSFVEGRRAVRPIQDAWCHDPKCDSAGKEHGHISLFPSSAPWGTHRWERWYELEILDLPPPPKFTDVPVGAPTDLPKVGVAEAADH